MYLLRLTATPTYSNQYKYCWLKKNIQRILYEVTAQQLMVASILYKPEIEYHTTNFETPVFEAKYIKNNLKITKIYRRT